MLTRLDIINAMLRSTGQRPLTSENTRHPMYVKADATLSDVELAVQSIGLWFNTECRPLVANTDNEMTVPANCLRADPADGSVNLTLRGRRMYNLDAGNYTVTGSVLMRMLFKVTTDEMPLAALQYIKERAVYEFYLDEDGSEGKLRRYEADKNEAWRLLWREHLINRQTNIADNPLNTVSQLRKGGSSTLFTNFN